VVEIAVARFLIGCVGDGRLLFTATALSWGWWNLQIDKFHVGLGGSPVGPTRRCTQLSTALLQHWRRRPISFEGAYIDHGPSTRSSLLINLQVGFKGYRGLWGEAK
jgi:hypothetical protein